MNNTRITHERQKDFLRIKIEGELNCLNADKLVQVLENEEITHYHLRPSLDPGILQRAKMYLQERFGDHHYDLPRELVLDLSQARIDSSIAVIAYELRKGLQPDSTLLVIPGENTSEVFDHLRMGNIFSLVRSYPN
jgi:hypothetical protein